MYKWIKLLYPFVFQYFDCFHVFAFVSSAALSIGMPVSLGIKIFSGYLPSSGISGLYDHSFFFFSF